MNPRVKTSQQCEIAKRKNERLLDQIRGTIVPKRCFEKLLGRGLPFRVLGFKNPVKILSSFYPNVPNTNNLTPRVFGCVSFVHGENLHETQLETLVLPSLEFTIHVPESKQTSLPSSSTENDLEVDKRFEKNLVYQRRPKDNNPVFQNETKTQIVESDLYLPIAFRKVTKKCTKKPLYSLSNYLSFHKISPTHQTFLANLNSISIPTTVFEALSDKNWK
ncbi:hypothetical protein CR513_49204, partial [Mucuna pruriens]